MGNVNTLRLSGNIRCDVPELGNSFAYCEYQIGVLLQSDGTYEVSYSWHGDDGRSDAMYWDGADKKQCQYEKHPDENKIILLPSNTSVNYKYDPAQCCYFATVSLDIFGSESRDVDLESESDLARHIREKDNENVLAFVKQAHPGFVKERYFWSVYDDFDLLRVLVEHGYLPQDYEREWKIEIETPERVQFFLANKILAPLNGTLAYVIGQSILKDRFDLLEIFKPYVTQLSDGEYYSLFTPQVQKDPKFLQKFLEAGFPLTAAQVKYFLFVSPETVHNIDLLLERKIIDLTFPIWERSEHFDDEETFTHLLDLGFPPERSLLAKCARFGKVFPRFAAGLQLTGEDALNELARPTPYDYLIYGYLALGLFDVKDDDVLKRLLKLDLSDSKVPFFLENGANPTILAIHYASKYCSSELFEEIVKHVDTKNLTPDQQKAFFPKIAFQSYAYWKIYRKYNFPIPAPSSESAPLVFASLYSQGAYFDLLEFSEVLKYLAELKFPFTAAVVNKLTNSQRSSNSIMRHEPAAIFKQNGSSVEYSALIPKAKRVLHMILTDEASKILLSGKD